MCVSLDIDIEIWIHTGQQLHTLQIYRHIQVMYVYCSILSHFAVQLAARGLGPTSAVAKVLSLAPWRIVGFVRDCFRGGPSSAWGWRGARAFGPRCTAFPPWRARAGRLSSVFSTCLLDLCWLLVCGLEPPLLDRNCNLSVCPSSRSYARLSLLLRALEYDRELLRLRNFTCALESVRELLRLRCGI